MKNILVSMAALLTVGSAAAQTHLDNDPLISVQDKDKQVKFTIGGRLMMDATYIKGDFTSLKSGAAMTDARIRTSLSWQDWYFYADFDFSRGKFKQKDLYARYTLGNHAIKMGYFCEPSTMSYNTSRYGYHFINRPSSVNVLGQGRSLGVAYKYTDQLFFFNQGVFAENKYNDQLSGFQGVSLSGRWLVKPIATDDNTLHLGVNARYARINTGVTENGILKTNLSMAASLENSVETDSRFLNAELPWAKDVLNLGAEALWVSPRFFARAEYLYKKVWKDRPDQKLFENQLGGVWSWTTLASWQKGNPLKASQFSGAYVETGYMICGDNYRYDAANGLLGGNKSRSLEVVARYNYTNLNDIKDGELFVIGRNQFYPAGEVSDYPATSTSVGGGKLHSFTVGLNYALNQYIQFMADYTFSRVDNVYYPLDKNIHAAQARIMFSF